MRWPQDGVVKLAALRDTPVNGVGLLGGGEVTWYQQAADGLTVHTAGRGDDGLPCSAAHYTVAIQLHSPAKAAGQIRHFRWALFWEK